MDLAEVKGRRRTGNKKDGFIIKADDLDWLIAEVERLTALCDGYRGEMEHLKRDNEKLAGGCVIAQRTYALSLDDITALTLEVERLQSALTRARAEAFEDAAKVFERRIAELRAANPDNHPDEEEEKWISGTAAAIRATKGDSDEG